MPRRILLKTLKISAIAISTLASFLLAVSLIRWASRPSPRSAEGLLARADHLAWNNNWLAAFPLYVESEQLFKKRGDQGHALYAHVSQVAVTMESNDLSLLIAELRRDLKLPEAAAPEVQLRIMEMKAKCEEEYDAGIATQTFAEVERLALQQHKLYLASRASGEQGILAFTLGNLADATSRVKRAYAVAKYLGDPAAHIRYAEMIGLGIEQLGRPKQALQFLDEAIAAQKKHPEVARPFVAYCAKIESLGQLGRYGEALALADTVAALSRQRRLYGQLQSLLTSEADVFARTGRIDKAISGYHEALTYAKLIRTRRAITNIDAKLAAAYERAGDLPKALSAIDEAIEANKQIPQELFLVPGNIAIKARIQRKLGRRAEAERLYSKGMDMLDALLTHVPTPEVERLLLTELGDLYSGFFELLSDEGRYGDAFRVIEQAHGRIEAQELEYDHTEVPRGLNAEEKRLQELELQLANTDDQNKRADIVYQIRGSRENGIIDRANEKTATLMGLRKQLQPDELLIEYVLSSPRSYALVINRLGAMRYALSEKKEIEEEATEYRDILRKHGTNSRLGRQLFRNLLGFTRDYPEAKSLLIVADGALHLLPFSALIDESGKYLLQTKSVGMTPSGTVLTLLHDRVDTSSESRPYLGVAAWTKTGETKPWVLRAISAKSKPDDLAILPQSRDEVESIAAMMPKPATVLIGPEATKQKFESLPLIDYRILHLALHGLVDPVFPDRSALAFAPSKNDNGRLQAKDIRRLHLNAELVTLSACDTGVGRLAPPVSKALTRLLSRQGPLAWYLRCGSWRTGARTG